MPAQKGIARKRAQKLAESLNCYIPNDWSKTIDCLRTVPEKNITAVSYKFVRVNRKIKRKNCNRKSNRLNVLNFNTRSISQIQYLSQWLNPNGRELL